jgi:DNA invertase Pin-like site-specific DNA recombinase
VIVDEDGVYDPRHPNDRLLLGMKGTMSEMELSLFRQRSLEALKQKARRGELFLTVAIGYLKTSHDRIEKDPDRRVQEAIMLAFTVGGQIFGRAAGNPGRLDRLDCRFENARNFRRHLAV